MNFIRDLRFSQVTEEAILRAVHKLPIPPACASQVTDKTCDIRLDIPIEVKRDRRALETGNVVVELGYKGRPSGLKTTEAILWIWQLGEDYWGVWTEDLKEYIGESPDIIMGGDGKQSELVLIPLYQFISRLAFKINLNEDREKDTGPEEVRQVAG